MLITTFRLPSAAATDEGNTIRLLQAWTAVDGDEEDDERRPAVLNMSITSYALPANGAKSSNVLSCFEAPPTDHPLYRQVMACVREARLELPTLPPVLSPLSPERQKDLVVTVCPDAIGYGQRLQPSVAMDLFERQRTGIIGGQPALAWLERAGIAVVVYRINHLRFPPVELELGSTLRCISSETQSANGLFYDVRQRMLCDRLEANEPGSELETDRGLADEDVSSDDGSDTGQTRGGTLDVIGLVKSRRPRITSTEHTFSPPASPLLQSDVDEYASYFSASGGLLQPPSFLEGASQSDTAQAPPALVADTGKAVRFALDEGETQGSRIVAECCERTLPCPSTALPPRAHTASHPACVCK